MTELSTAAGFGEARGGKRKEGEGKAGEGREWEGKGTVAFSPRSCNVCVC